MTWFVNKADPSEKVQAVQFIGDFDAIEEFVGGDAEFRSGVLVVATRHGRLTAKNHEWIVKQMNGVFVVYTNALFYDMYKLAPLGLDN